MSQASFTSLICHSCPSVFNDSHCTSHSLKCFHLVSKDLYDQTQSCLPRFSSTCCFLMQTRLSPQQHSGMTDSFLAWSLHCYALRDAFMHIQPSHFFFIREIVIKGLLRHSKHAKYSGEQKKKRKKKHSFCPHSACKFGGRHGHLSSKCHISKCEIVSVLSATTKNHIVL